ncbi:MAG: NAD(P)-binding domain-containing protein [Myxococcales bacterium]|nr:NAD(P)-binding domain-containing protein [Myxococcales bacterium]
MSGLTVAVIGGGRWARALAGFLLHNQRRAPDRITKVLHYRPPRELVRAQEDNRSEPDAAPLDVAVAAGEVPDVSAVDSAQQAERRQVTSINVSELGQADVIFLAVPAPSVRKVLRLAAPHLHGAQSLIHAIGSVIPACEEHPHTTLISHAVGEETPIRKVGGLAGPALAPDLEEFAPAALVCGSRFDEVGTQAIQVLSGHSLLVYTTRDLIGVELSRAGSSVIALAAGVANILDLGTPARAILITRGAAELARIAVKLGAEERTFFGLAGVGEFVAATERRGSADFELGRLLGQRVPLAEAQKQVGRVCDGPSMVREAHLLGHKFHVRTSIVSALYQLLHGKFDTKDALMALLSTDIHNEHE